MNEKGERCAEQRSRRPGAFEHGYRLAKNWLTVQLGTKKSIKKNDDLCAIFQLSNCFPEKNDSRNELKNLYGFFSAWLIGLIVCPSATLLTYGLVAFGIIYK